ncbi:MAG: DUF2867 domain-containing protein [Acidiferrobacter sp.]
MNPTVAAIEVPPGSEISRHLQDADFYDCYEREMGFPAVSALALYLTMVSRTPAWVNGLMAIRNRAVSLIGLKDLGHLGAISASKPTDSYRVGDRVGIFTILQMTDKEVILGDADKHLQVKVSVCKLSSGERHSVAVSTVVHTHNTLGRLYMLFVAPVHRVIAPAMLARVATGTVGHNLQEKG